MEQVRIIDDDTRFYVILENATDDDKKKLFNLVANWMGLKEKEREEKEEKPKGMMPVKVSEVPIPTEPKKDSSIRVPRKISTKKVFWNLYNQLDQVAEEDREKAVEVLTAFMKQYMMKINHTNVKTFFLEFEPVFHRMIEQVLNAEGYSELKDYLETECSEKINSLLLECKNNLKKIII